MNKLKISKLMVISFFSISAFFIAKETRGQSVLSKTRFPAPDSSQYFSFRFQLNSRVDSNSTDGLLFFTNAQGLAHPLIFKLSVAGALLCFSDSLLSFPILIEKRNTYPFRSLKNGDFYEVQVWKTNGYEGFARCRWLDLRRNQVLDEIFVCLPIVNLRFSKPGTTVRGYFKIK